MKIKNNYFTWLSLAICGIFLMSFVSSENSTTVNGTYRGLISYTPNTTGVCNVSSNGNTVTVTSSSEAALPSDVSKVVFDQTTIINPNGSMTIPNDGQKWWVVPFDASKTPQIANGGSGGGGGGGGLGEWVFKCLCGGIQEAGCVVVTNSTSQYCNPSQQDPCSLCCQGVMQKSGSIALSPGSYFLLPAEILNFNGTNYQ